MKPSFCEFVFLFCVVRASVDENKFLMTVNELREAKEIPLKNQLVKEVELLADKFQNSFCRIKTKAALISTQAVSPLFIILPLPITFFIS